MIGLPSGPDLRIYLMSGYTPEHVEELKSRYGLQGMIHKPFTLDEFERALRGDAKWESDPAP